MTSASSPLAVILAGLEAAAYGPPGVGAADVHAATRRIAKQVGIRRGREVFKILILRIRACRSSVAAGPPREVSDYDAGMPNATPDPGQVRTCRLLLALGMNRVDAERTARTVRKHHAFRTRGGRLAIFAYRESDPAGGDRIREAWILLSVLGWGERESAIALDCSRTALRGHLEQAASQFDEVDVEALRRVVDAYLPGPMEAESVAAAEDPYRLLRWLGWIAVSVVGLEVLRRLVVTL